VVTQLVAYPVKKPRLCGVLSFLGLLCLLCWIKPNHKDVSMDNEKATQHIEERAEAVAEEILMLYVMDGMKAKEKVKQLLMQFAVEKNSNFH
jgi:hypothetical protein